MTTVGVPRERAGRERRVALTPDGVARLINAGRVVPIGEQSKADPVRTGEQSKARPVVRVGEQSRRGPWAAMASLC
ncbi:MAG TPA: hypothetical protein VGB74_01600 [Actinoplanes sp.]